MVSRSSRILYNEKVADSFYRMGLAFKVRRARAGQFLMLRVSEGFDPLLRRPLGLYRLIGENGGRAEGLEILYKAVGRGTRILSTKEAGEEIGVIGPLGNGFPSPGKKKKKVIMVAGSVGIVPFHIFAKANPGSVLLYGGRGKVDASLAKDFEGLPCTVKIATEDGSVGRKGLVTELLKDEITPDSIVYACGPRAMLKSAARIAESENVPCYVSLESAMACGIGVCLGCAVKTRNHEEEKGTYKMVCSEGPVFDSNTIDWERA